MDGSFGNNNQGGRDRRDLDREMSRGNDRGGDRNKLMNEIMSEMQSGMNMPNNGTNPVMNMQQFGGNMGMPGMAGGPGMGMGMGPGMGGQMGMAAGGQGMGMAGGPGMAGIGPQIAGPMGNPIMGNDYAYQGPNPTYPSTGGCDPNMGSPEGMQGDPRDGQLVSGHGPVEEEYEDDDGPEDGNAMHGVTRLRSRSKDDDDDSDTKSGSMVDNLLESGKEPLIGAIILMMLLSPQFTGLFNQLLPRVSENLIYNLLAKGLIFFIIFYLVQRFL